MKQSESRSHIQSQYRRSEPFTISPCGSPGRNSLSHDLEASPLIACSYQTMQQEYDRDTWRMYERIQSARESHEQQPISFIEDTVQSVNLNDFDDDDEDPFTEQETDDESEGIFEFDF
jgi:hypothetical protein